MLPGALPSRAACADSQADSPAPTAVADSPGIQRVSPSDHMTIPAAAPHASVPSLVSPPGASSTTSSSPPRDPLGVAPHLAAPSPVATEGGTSDSPAAIGSAPDPASTADISNPGSSVAEPPARRPATRLQSGIRKPKVITDGRIPFGNPVTLEPTKLQDALGDAKWKGAMDQEFMALLKNKTWHLVPPQQGKNVINCKWVYKIKKRVDGTIDGYKAR